MYPQIIAAFYASPWAIMPEKLEEIRAFLRLKSAGGDVSAEDLKKIIAARRPDGVQMVGRVAVVPVMGTIAQRVGSMDRASGGVSTEEIGATLDGLVKDPGVKSILMQFDSPGGSVAGVPELAARIRAARDQKKITAFVDPMAASAAYWLASQANEIVITPSGQVGSIGVLTAHDDITAALEKAGVKATLISSAPFKTERWPEMALTEEAKAAMQATVDAYHKTFVGDIAKGRGIAASKVDANFGQGRMVLAQDALAAGMVDRIATMDQVLKRLGAVDGMNAKLAAARVRALEIEEG